MFCNVCSLFQAADDMVRMLFGCLCFLLVGGPIMFIVGIVVLTSDNNRASKVAAYNEAVANFDTTGMPAWPFSGSMGELSSPQPYTMSNVSMSLVVDGNQEGLIPGFTYYGSNNVPVSTTPLSLVLSATGSSVISRNGVPRTATYTYSVKCTSSTSCSSSNMLSRCQSRYATATYSGGTCSADAYCGCSVLLYLTEYCAVLRRLTVASWTESFTYASCRYPFGANDQAYTTTTDPFSLNMRLYSSDDPLITLEAQTQGTRNFGLTADQQRSIGIGLIVAGIVLSVIVCGGCFFAIRLATSRQAPIQPAPASQMVSMSQPPPPQQQMGYAGGQQPVYGQPVAYGQPQVGGYGAPPPPAPGAYGGGGGYGAPPPPQQPGYGYGAPPQGYGYGGQPPPPQAPALGYGAPPPQQQNLY